MKYKLLLAVMLCVLTPLALATSTTGAQTPTAGQGVLYFYNWTDYISPKTLDNFEKATGIQTVYDVYDSNEVLEGKLLSGRSGFDLVSPSHDFYKTQVHAGVYMKLDKSRLPNLKNLDPWLMKRISDAFDKDNAYGIPYLWGTTGIGYNRKAVEKVLGKDAPTDSWALVFEPKNMEKLQQCGVAFIDAPSEVLPSIMAYMGKPGDSLAMKDYRAAVSKMKTVVPYITYFNASRMISDLANGDVCVAVGWSGDMLMARNRAREVNNGVEISYSVPKEGSAMWIDMLAIPADARHKEAAHKMLNYLMEPDVMADITNYVTYANAVPAAKSKVDKKIATDPTIYPDNNVMNRLFIFKELPRRLKSYITREWTRLKTNRE